MRKPLGRTLIDFRSIGLVKVVFCLERKMCYTTISFNDCQVTVRVQLEATLKGRGVSSSFLSPGKFGVD